MKHNHMIEALTPNGTNDALHVGSLPRGARRGQHFANAHVAHLVPKGIAEDGIPVPQQVTRELVKGKGLPQLLSRPLGGWVGCHIAVQDAARRSWARTRNTYSTWKRRVGRVKKSMETNCWA
jgi:hypothetical protein